MRYDDFPEPLTTLSTGPVYSRRQVAAWQNLHWPDGHPSWGKVRWPKPIQPRQGRRYEQIAANLRDRITSGEWPPGTKLPSRIELGEQYGVSAGAMARPIADLCADRVLISIRASGTYVPSSAKE